MGNSLSWLAQGILHGGPLFVKDWILAHAGVLRLHFSAFLESFKVRSITGWFKFNFEVFALLWGIEINHSLDEYLFKRSGAADKVRALAHVDTLSNWSFGSFFAKKIGNPLMMNKTSGPSAKDLVLIGGGHAHAYVIKSLGMNPEPGVQVTLITHSYDTPYSGMLPQYVAGVYTHDECHIDLARLCSFGKVRLVLDEVCGIDKEKKEIQFSSGRPNMRYDVVSIDIGSTPGLMTQTPVLTPVKPISQFSAKWNALIAKNVKHITVVGAGAGGVELLLSMQHRLPDVKFTLISGNDTVCGSHNLLVQKSFLRILKERNVRIVFNFRVASVENSTVLVSTDNQRENAEEIIWCTDAETQKWMSKGGLACDPGGFVRVDDHLESVNSSGIFAVGDCSNMINYPRPKAGVFAVRQGPPLAQNLRIALRCSMNGKAHKGQLEKYIPQSSFLGIIGTGAPYCVASRGEMALEGEWLFHLKDWIDRKWMASYSTQLPIMVEPEKDIKSDDELAKLTDKSLMRCGGCGAKVGKSVLEQVVQKMHVPKRPEVIVGLDSPDDCAIVKFGDAGVAQTVDYFRSFIDDPYLFGQIAANHSLSDIHAMGADAISAMAIAVVPFASNNVVEGNLLQLMAGACKVLADANCALVGGHSCEGQELSLGLSVSGLTNEGKYLSKGGCKFGDLIVQTKPIGTGVIFAANMRVLAKGSWVYGAVSSMLKSNRDDAELALQLGATACTDITGFGLAGHLAEMINASSGVSAEIDINSVPLLEGALECVKAGVLSSIQAENARIVHVIENHNTVCGHESYPLLFDPQTSGGLLITISSKLKDKFPKEWTVIGKIGLGSGIKIKI